MAKCIMVQGTMSSAGKSLLVTGLCRVFHQAGYRVAPFKSQNMSSNAFLTPQGLAMSKAQVLQAEAAGVTPDVRMNPILLKPASDVGAEVVVLGRSQGHMSAGDYFAHKPSLVPTVMEAFQALATEYDIMVIEGAGSPAELNLKEHDIVNMGLAKLVDAPVLLVGDIDCGGVFAQLVGTLVLLEPEERVRVKGTIVNKFRGDRTLFAPGVDILEEKTGVPVVGVLPYLDVNLEEEDSLHQDLSRDTSRHNDPAFRQSQYDKLADAIRANLDMDYIYKVLEGRV